ncbi:hypothetical protein TWF694_004461 [Orbilia ellipsospora]|uniref:Uncharacterized protein n=1 Tax=Orbilia ellipsospora TaxID=2528407 RepID=A0AAV9WV70_9PEZI
MNGANNSLSFESGAAKITRPCGFFSLPREIRDEIYKYLLVFDTDAILQGPRAEDSHPLLLNIDLSILRVSRQIHNEAAKIFYSHNVFPIKICVIAHVYRRDTQEPWTARVKVFYKSLWDSFNHSLAFNDHEITRVYVSQLNIKYWNPQSIAQLECEPLPNDYKLEDWIEAKEYPGIGQFCSPSPRYRHFIRRLRIEIQDNRSDEWFSDIYDHLYGIKAAAVNCSNILMAFLPRIRILLADVNGIPHVDIVAKHCSRPSRLFWRHIAAEGTRPPRISASTYAEIIKTAWLLSRGRWTWTLSSPTIYNTTFPGCLHAALSDCDRSHSLNQDNFETEMRELKIEVSGTRFWATQKGRLLLVSDATEV